MSAEKNLDNNSDCSEIDNKVQKDISDTLKNLLESFDQFSDFHSMRIMRINERLQQMEEEIQEGKTESLEPFVELSLDMSTMLNRKGFYRQALIYVEKGITACEKLLEEKSRFGILRYPMILYLYADILHALKKGDLPTAYIKAELAYEGLLGGKIKIPETDYVNCSRDYAECLLDHAVYLYEIHRSDIEAVALLQKAKQKLPLFEEASREERVGFLVSLYSNLTRCMLRIGDENGGILVCDELVENLQKEKKLTFLIKEGMIRSWKTIASIMRKQGSVCEAIKYYHKCQSYHKEHRLRPRKNKREDLFASIRIEEAMQKIRFFLIESYIQNKEYENALMEIQTIKEKDDFIQIEPALLNGISGFDKLPWNGSLSSCIRFWKACCLRHVGQLKEALVLINAVLAEELKNESPSLGFVGQIRMEQAKILLQLGNTNQAALSLEIASNDFIKNQNNQIELKEEDVLQTFLILQFIAENANCFGKSQEKEYYKTIHFGSDYLNQGMVSLRYPLACAWMKYSTVCQQSGNQKNQKEACLNAFRILTVLHSEVQDSLIPEPKNLKEDLRQLLEQIISLVPENEKTPFLMLKSTLNFK